MAAVEKVLIVGGGIGGLSAAIALSRAGIRVEVAEIQREWTIYQVGIVVQANFIRAMAALGNRRSGGCRGVSRRGLGGRGPGRQCAATAARSQARRSELPGESGHDPTSAAQGAVQRGVHGRRHDSCWNDVSSRAPADRSRTGRIQRRLGGEIRSGSRGRRDLFTAALATLRHAVPAAIHRPGHLALQRAASVGGELFILLHGRGTAVWQMRFHSADA